MPRIQLEDVEDYYTYYVEILHISENLFWYADISFVKKVAENKAAYDGWMIQIREEEMRSINGR